MAKKPTDQDGATQDTPKGHKIPVPTREHVLADLLKVAKPENSESDARSPKQKR